MRNQYNLAAVLSAVVLVCCAALILSQGVNAAGEGKITGTVKLDGRGSAHEGHRHEQGPLLREGHILHPGTLENYVVGAGGGLGECGSLHRRLERSCGAVKTTVPVFDQKELHVRATRVWQWT